jgi:NCAIR mutase (PurE)-related protein
MTERIQIDTEREQRQGFSEAIYGEGKSLSQLNEIAHFFKKSQQPLLITRLEREAIEQLTEQLKCSGKVKVSSEGGTFCWWPESHQVEPNSPERIALVSAGASDEAVLQEAEMTLAFYGFSSFRVCDAGVAGIHRLLKHKGKLQQAQACIVIAGMDGALPSVVGGLVGAPVVAVPTSVGYGSSLGGISALLSMLNSCASGVTVVNIDNGYGAAMAVVRIIQHHPQSSNH